jgi:holo-[acyl-carrier protein] synthase
MTVLGVGTDLVDLDRFRLVLERTPSIVDRLFTEDEQRYADARSDPTERYGARFAAKEAVLKAMGLGLGSVGFREIEVVRAESGAPSVVLHGRAATAARARGVGHWLLSMSHTATVAHAIAMAVPTSPAAVPTDLATEPFVDRS